MTTMVNDRSDTQVQTHLTVQGIVKRSLQKIEQKCCSQLPTAWNNGLSLSHPDTTHSHSAGSETAAELRDLVRCSLNTLLCRNYFKNNPPFVFDPFWGGIHFYCDIADDSARGLWNHWRGLTENQQHEHFRMVVEDCREGRLRKTSNTHVEKRDNVYGCSTRNCWKWDLILIG